jgi:hypothetical protein
MGNANTSSMEMTKKDTTTSTSATKEDTTTTDDEKKEPNVSYPVGTKIIASDKFRHLYCATVIQTSKDTVTVTWPGYDQKWNEEIRLDSGRLFSLEKAIATLKETPRPLVTAHDPKEVAKLIIVKASLVKLKHLGSLQTNDQSETLTLWDEVNCELELLCKDIPLWFRVFYNRGEFLKDMRMWMTEKGYRYCYFPRYEMTSGPVVICIAKKLISTVTEPEGDLVSL